MGIYKSVIALIVMISVMAIYTYGEATETNEDQHQLLEIIATMKAKEIEIENWKLYTRSSISTFDDEKGVNQQLQELFDKTEDFQWRVETDGKDKRYVGFIQHPNSGITETVTFLAYPHKTNFHTYLIYEVNGNGWDNQEWLSFSPILSDRSETFFDSNSPIFTCVTGKSSDKLENGLEFYANEFVDAFSAQKIEGLNEETFVSLSAYTDQWETSIQSKHEKINLQIALRNNERLGGGITVTIGTPIITSEY